MLAAAIVVGVVAGSAVAVTAQDASSGAAFVTGTVGASTVIGFTHRHSRTADTRFSYEGSEDLGLGDVAGLSRPADRVAGQLLELLPQVVRWFAAGRLALHRDAVAFDGEPLQQPIQL